MSRQVKREVLLQHRQLREVIRIAGRRERFDGVIGTLDVRGVMLGVVQLEYFGAVPRLESRVVIRQLRQ